MIIEIKLPTRSLNKERKSDEQQGTVTEIAVKVGDTLVEGQTFMTVEMSKTDMEIPIETAGVVVAICVAELDDVFAHTVLMTLKIAENAVNPSATTAAVDNTTPPQYQAVEKGIADKMPVVVPTQTPPQYAAQKSPILKEMPIISPTILPHETKGKVISPLAEKLIKELNINRIALLEDMPEGRISRVMVKDFAKKQLSLPPQYAGAKSRPLPDFSKFGAIERQKMSSTQVKTADNLTYAFTTVPHAWITEKADLTDLELMRQRYKKQVSEAGGALTLTAILTKIVAVALQQMPIFNASVDMDNRDIILKNYVHIGVAVDTERGLFVPVIRDADRKRLTDIALELTRFSTDLRENRPSNVPMEGGTFTISNVGGIGGTGIFPIVNTPQAAILGITATQLEPQPTPEKDGIIWRPMLPMTLGFDHRLINGAEATRFLKLLKSLIQEPMRLIV